MSAARHDGEPADPLLRAMAEYWDEILAAATSEQRNRLQAVVSGAAEPDPTEARAAIADELLDILPFDHPVIRVLRARVLYGSGILEPAELADSLRRLSLLVLSADGTAWPDDGDGQTASSPPETETNELDRRVQARLLSLPGLTAQELDQGHIGIASGHLIRLPRPDRTWQFPAFQFGGDLNPWPIVQEVNELLNADDDPWGVSCWWVDPHEWLQVPPAELLGTGQDDLLRLAARAVGEEF